MEDKSVRTQYALGSNDQEGIFGLSKGLPERLSANLTMVLTFDLYKLHCILTHILGIFVYSSTFR